MSCLGLFALLLLPTMWIGLAVTASPRIKAYGQSRRNAEEKADQLLRSWLTWEQRRQWRSSREFEVIGCDTGTRYRITTFNSLMNPVAASCAGASCQKVNGPAFTLDGEVVVQTRSFCDRMLPFSGGPKA
jgi:hypothetical protein